MVRVRRWDGERQQGDDPRRAQCELRARLVAGVQPKSGAASIQQLAQRIGVSLTAIHRHIRVLEDAKLIRRKKSGRVNFLAINRATMRGVQDWAQQYHAYWGTDEETLENYVAAIERAQHPATAPESKERNR